MPLLISDDDYIEIDMWYEEKDSFKISEKEEVGWNKETFKFKRPSWGTISQIMANSLVVLKTGAIAINPVVYADAKIRSLLSGWTLKDKDGKVFLVTPDNISKLNPDICSYLSSKLDKYVVLGGVVPPVVSDSEVV